MKSFDGVPRRWPRNRRGGLTGAAAKEIATPGTHHFASPAARVTCQNSVVSGDHHEENHCPVYQETYRSGSHTRGSAILRESAQEFNHQFEFEEFPIGGAAIDAAGTPLPMKHWTAAAKPTPYFWSGRRPKWDALPSGSAPSVDCSICEKAWALRQRSSSEAARIAERNFALESDRLGDLDLRLCVNSPAECILASTARHGKGVERLGHGVVFHAGDRTHRDVCLCARENGRGGYAPWTKRTY